MFGTYPTGIDWASARVVLEMPIEEAYARLLDHRNLGDEIKASRRSARDTRDMHRGIVRAFARSELHEPGIE